MNIINDTSITNILSTDKVKASIFNAPSNDLKEHIDTLNDHHNQNLTHDGDLIINGNLTLTGELKSSGGFIISPKNYHGFLDWMGVTTLTQTLSGAGDSGIVYCPTNNKIYISDSSGAIN